MNVSTLANLYQLEWVNIFILPWHTFLTFFRVAHRLWRWNSASIHDLKISQNNGNLRPWSIIISYWGSITNISYLCKARTPIWYGRRLQNWPVPQWFDLKSSFNWLNANCSTTYCKIGTCQHKTRAESTCKTTSFNNKNNNRKQQHYTSQQKHTPL